MTTKSGNGPDHITVAECLTTAPERAGYEYFLADGDPPCMVFSVGTNVGDYRYVHDPTRAVTG